MKYNVLTIDSEDIRRINRTARRNALKRSGQLNTFKPKVEGSKKRYTRKTKHKGGVEFD